MELYKIVQMSVILFSVNIIFSRTLTFLLLPLRYFLFFKKYSGLIRGLLCIIVILKIFWSADKYVP